MQTTYFLKMRMLQLHRFVSGYVHNNNLDYLYNKNARIERHFPREMCECHLVLYCNR